MVALPKQRKTNLLWCLSMPDFKTCILDIFTSTSIQWRWMVLTALICDIWKILFPETIPLVDHPQAFLSNSCCYSEIYSVACRVLATFVVNFKKNYENKIYSPYWLKVGGMRDFFSFQWKWGWKKCLNNYLIHYSPCNIKWISPVETCFLKFAQAYINCTYS